MIGRPITQSHKVGDECAGQDREGICSSLIECVKNKSQSARILALRALAEIKDHRAIPVMMQVMDEESVLLQHWAKAGLERLGLDMVYIKPV